LAPQSTTSGFGHDFRIPAKKAETVDLREKNLVVQVGIGSGAAMRQKAICFRYAQRLVGPDQSAHLFGALQQNGRQDVPRRRLDKLAQRAFGLVHDVLIVLSP
jgi:hypothetical protein